MNREYKILIEKYLETNNTIMTYTSEDDIENDLDIFIKSIKFNIERPDLYGEFKNKLIGLEHFEFDSYKSLARKKGSDYKKKESQIKKEFDNLTKLQMKESFYKNYNISNTASKENFLDNFKKKFENHYAKIDAYFNNLSLINPKIEKEIWFFIEDESPLGSYTISREEGLKIVKPFQFTEIQEFLLKHNLVKKILYGYFNGRESKLLLIDNDKEAYNRFIIDYKMADDEKCFWFDVNVTGFSSIIKM